MSEFLRAAIRDGNAMRAAKLARRARAGKTTAIVCGLKGPEDARRMAEWIKEEESR